MTACEKYAKLHTTPVGRTAMRTTTIVVMCKSGRLDAMAEALLRSPRKVALYILSEVHNPGLRGKAKKVIQLKTDDRYAVADIVRDINPDFVLIGPEANRSPGNC
jgi:phosphoribosylamine-glycine ligase